MQELLPAAAAVVATTADSGLDGLMPGESEVIAGAVAGRQHEFATVRRCAREALGRLGVPAAAILPGPRGAPGWPAGIVGSMTHCRGYRAAAVARSAELAALGIDAEPAAELPTGVLQLVAGPQEQRQLAELSPDMPWPTVLFCAKEAVYKAWYPLAGRWLDFHQVRVRLDPERGSFHAALLVPGPTVAGSELAGFDGRFAITPELVLAAVAVTAR
ncbi:MAG TPA: 4'-phosphopantetheinyl transferase superfamily protein [Jatrophihabitans sp.]|nr:4'-phosphopantetheinyl transferase superfamily protein [Jatrophihabitans sp.]